MAGEFETMEDRLFAEEKEYLSEMIRKIGDQIEKTKEALSKGQKEIDNMQDRKSVV